MNDWRGKPIKIGSHVVYPVTFSSSITMNAGVVEEITTKREHSWSDKTIPVLIVRTVSEKRYGAARAVDRQVTLTRIDRVTVVAP